MSEYPMFINKKRKPMEEKSRAVRIEEIYDAVKVSYDLLQDVTDKKEFAELFRAVAQKEARAKILGYESCREEADTPLMHKKIKEVERMRILLKKRYASLT